MKIYEKNLKQSLKIMNIAILLHIPVFLYMANFFDTEVSIAVGAPLVLFVGQKIFELVFKNLNVPAILMGFSSMALSATMIHLGKGMIEWHFHIFVFIGILSIFANPYTIVAAALTAAIHHVSFFYFLPESVFNYNASIYIVIIHAAFVVVESIACFFLSNQFKKSLDLQDRIQIEIEPLVVSIDSSSKSSSKSCSTLLDLTGSNSSAISEISTGASRISEMAIKTKEKIEETLDLMKQTQSSVRESSAVIKDGESFLESLNEIKNQMEDLQSLSASQLQSVVDSVNTISEKTGIINDIVFQTKLLSFNASVEAARAGEQGKGFAVVAEEIGGLATSSGRASEEISKIVEDSRNKLSESVGTISNKLSDFQSRLEDAFTSWEDINNRLKQSFIVVESNSVNQEASLNIISEGADEQCDGVSELSSALSSIDDSSNKSLQQLREIEDITKRLEEDSKMLSSLQSNLSKKKQRSHKVVEV
ncbi:methyl-accepting chemotaxis protein [Halobacteriovorax sp.]|uniref:methyl-accepting chemotaxis protein n=1 Tax=Halobacteriovorax sp. TaxID=2020862 RepID=UPI0035615A08